MSAASAGRAAAPDLAQEEKPMAPFNLPWSTFGAFAVLAATIVLAVIWALWDRARDRKGGP